MLSKYTLKRYATGVLAISDAAADYVAAIIDRAVAEGLGVAEVREIAIEAIMASADTYGDMCRELACQLYEAETGKEAAFPASSEVDREAVTERVHYHAGKLADGNAEGFLKACKAEAYSLAKRNVNQSVIDSCYRSRRRRRKGGYTGGVRFARIPQGGETCTFCAMLASRGFVYWSRETAGEFNHYHAHCRCLVVPDDGSGEVEGYDPDEWYSRWKKLDELDGAGGLTDKQRRAAKAYIARNAALSMEDAVGLSYELDGRVPPTSEEVPEWADGKKFSSHAKKHAAAFGLDYRTEEGRTGYDNLLSDTMDSYDAVTFDTGMAGQGNDECAFYFKGDDIAIVNVSKNRRVSLFQHERGFSEYIDRIWDKAHG